MKISKPSWSYDISTSLKPSSMHVKWTSRRLHSGLGYLDAWMSNSTLISAKNKSRLYHSTQNDLDNTLSQHPRHSRCYEIQDEISVADPFDVTCRLQKIPLQAWTIDLYIRDVWKRGSQHKDRIQDVPYRMSFFITFTRNGIDRAQKSSFASKYGEQAFVGFICQIH